MRARVSWGSNADEMGFAQPHNVFNLFNSIVGNDDFTMTTQTSDTLVLEGSLGFGGFALDLRMTLRGEGITYAGTEVTAGTLNRITVNQITDTQDIARIFDMRGLEVSMSDLVAAIDFQDNGGSGDTVANLLYGDGWIYQGVPSVDVIDPNAMFLDGGTPFYMLGDDRVLGGRGNDTILTLQGNDVVKGGGGNDVINGGLGRDVLKGGKGHDTIRGDDAYWEGGRDKISGGAGRDVIDAGIGNDRVNGGRGNDWMVDAEGRDTFIFKGRSGHDWLHDTDNQGANLVIRTDKEIEVTFLNVEDELSSGPWEGEYFDRGYLIEWGRNSLLINTYGDIEDFGLSDYTLLS